MVDWSEVVEMVDVFRTEGAAERILGRLVVC